MSHRSKPFDGILERAQDRLRTLLNLPADEYEVLFLQGGASLQFAMVPVNLAQPGKPVEVVHTGNWTEMALKELKTLEVEHRVLASGEASRWTALPELESLSGEANASYRYFCSNNTIEGTQFQTLPRASGDSVPWVGDFSSDFLSRPINVRDFGLIFAGAQKNLGPAGVTVVIVRKDLLTRTLSRIPTLMKYAVHAQSGSRYNTPPTFAIYVAGLVLDWIHEQGGLAAMHERNVEKAKLVYDAIDESNGFYEAPVRKADRSLMNLVWRLRPSKAALEERFLKEAKAEGLLELKGHRLVGGFRASLYNAQTLEAARALAQFLRHFASKNATD
jgi:phosphoserine aminotransferase